MIVVARRARRHPDRAGDPLDGLVNMFDLGIVLAVAFLIAGFSLSRLLTKRDAAVNSAAALVVRPNERVVPLEPGGQRLPVTGGKSIGQVYRLPAGQLVYVTKR